MEILSAIKIILRVFSIESNKAKIIMSFDNYMNIYPNII